MLTLRATKGSQLTIAEGDANFSGLADGTNWAASVTASSTLTVGTLTVSTGDLTVSAGKFIGPANLVGDWFSLLGGNGVNLTAGIHSNASGGAFWNVPTGKDHTWRINNVDALVLNGSGLTLSVAGVSRMNWTGSVFSILHDSSAVAFGVSQDLLISRDAANTLAQRNGTTAQEFRVWNTFTSLTNGEFGKLEWVSNVFRIGTEKGSGGGTARALSLVTDDTVRWTITGTDAGLVSGSNARFAHGTSALATTDTEGFLHLQSCAGAPTGVPATIPTGQIPMVIDSTNSRIYTYIGGAWKSVAVA